MNNAVNVTYTDKLTASEWKVIHNALEEERQTEKRYFRKQKALGCALIAVSVLLPILLQDVTASVFLLPLGIGVVATKDKVVFF